MVTSSVPEESAMDKMGNDRLAARGPRIRVTVSHDIQHNPSVPLGRTAGDGRLSQRFLSFFFLLITFFD